MVWKTNFDRLMENYVAPVAFRPSSASETPRESPHPTPLSALAAPAFPAAPVPSKPVTPSSGSGRSAPRLVAPPPQRRQPPVEVTTVHPRHEEYEMEVPPPLNLSDLPDSLSATLQVRGVCIARVQHGWGIPACYPSPTDAFRPAHSLSSLSLPPLSTLLVSLTC